MSLTRTFDNGCALLIAVANYPNVSPLPGAVLNDASEIERTLKSDACGYPAEGRVKVLTDGAATAAGIESGFRWLTETAGAEDTAVVYFSGHGGRVEDGPGAGSYLLSYEADLDRLPDTSIAGATWAGWLADVRAERLLVVLDCCHAGAFQNTKSAAAAGAGAGASAYKEGLAPAYFDALKVGAGRVVIASSRMDELSLVTAGAANSLFTTHLLAALRGGARTRGDGVVRVWDVFDHLAEKVAAASAGRQHPQFAAQSLENNFAVSLYRGGKSAARAAPETRLGETAVNRTVLREAIVAEFDTEELEVLCDDLTTDLQHDGILQNGQRLRWDDLPGRAKEARVRHLIRVLDTHYRALSYLVARVRKLRPHVRI